MAATHHGVVHLAARGRVLVECTGSLARSTSMGLMHSFHFLHPVWLLGLPAALAIASWFTRHKARDGAWSRVIDAPLLNQLQLGEFRRGLSPWWLIASLWSLCAIALAGPAWERAPAAGYRT